MFVKTTFRFFTPGPHPKYECVKDGIYVVLDIDIISKDSDKDGLTDIVEDKFHLDKYKYDTNENGISDYQDFNPRVNYPRTEKSKIYESIIDNKIDWNLKNGKGKLLFNNVIRNISDSVETILIVTDDEELMGIRPSKYRIIFMTNEEYQNQLNGFKTELNKMSISSLFEVDNRKNTYQLRTNFNTGGCSYLIKKTKKGWVVEIISMWIY